MFNRVVSYAALTLSTISAVSSFVVPRSSPPAGYAADYLESYDVYHTRYMALGCNNQSGTPFFDECCLPLAAESLEATPAQCVPSASASSQATSQ